MPFLQSCFVPKESLQNAIRINHNLRSEAAAAIKLVFLTPDPRYCYFAIKYVQLRN